MGTPLEKPGEALRRSVALCVALSVSAIAGAVSAGEARVQAGIESDAAFVVLLDELSNSSAEAQPQLMYRVADLPRSRLVGTVAHIPLAHYEVEAEPNTIGLRDVHYVVASDRDGTHLRLRRVQFYFATGDEVDHTSCARFDVARAQLGLSIEFPAAPAPEFLHGQRRSSHGIPHRQEDRRSGERASVFVSTNNSSKPCLWSAWIQFHEPNVHPDSGRHETRPEASRQSWGFEADALRTFTGDQGGDYIPGHALLSDQIGTAMGVPDGPDRRAQRSWSMDQGYVLTFGCHQHNCIEKGAVISDAEGRVVRAALISFNCKARQCERAPTLTIFKHPMRWGATQTRSSWTRRCCSGDSSACPEYRSELLRWARPRGSSPARIGGSVEVASLRSTACAGPVGRG